LGTGGTTGPDAATGGSSGAGGTGGTTGGDAGIDLAPTGGTGGGGAGGTTGIDASLDRPSPDGSDAHMDAPGDGGSVADADGGDGGETGEAGGCLSPTAAWAYAVPGLTNIAWDKDGSLITGREFYGIPSFGPLNGGTPLAVTNNGSADILVAKLNPSTGNPSWVFTAGDPKDQKVTGVAVTSAGLGVVGTFGGTLQIGTGSPAVNVGSTMIDYIAGVADDGTGVWAKKINLGNGKLNAIAGQPGKDYFVVCGAATNNAANLSATGAALGTPGGSNDVVVAAVKASDGTIVWSKMFGQAMDQSCTAAAIDDSGDAVFAGSYAGTLDFGLGTLSPAPTAATDHILWVAKFNGTTGATIAAKAFGTTGSVLPHALTADAQGNLIVAGEFTGADVTFGSKVLSPLSPVGGSDAWVARLDGSLTPSWARSWGGTTATCMGAAVDSTGNATVVGTFDGTIPVGPGSAVLTSHPSATLNLSNVLETFVVSLDGSTGQTLCAHNYGDGASKGGGAQAVAINRWATGGQQNATAIVGSFTAVVDFGVTALSSTGNSIAYLLRM
jgi:hypothetical protein